MLNTLLHKLNNKTLSMVIGCLLLLVCAFPVPSILDFTAIQDKVERSDDECARLEEKHHDLLEREQSLSKNLTEMDSVLNGRLGGINSALLLRNIILKLAGVNQIETSSCLFRDSQLMNQSPVSALGLGKDIYSVVIDIKGSAYLEDLLVFIYILEELEISLQMKEFSVADLANESRQYSFSTSFTGFYVIDNNEN